MTRKVRFSLDRNARPTTREGHYGILEGDVIHEEHGAEHALTEVRLLPPCWPTKIVCVGRNYHEHASELGNPLPAEPLIFLKPPSAVLAHGDAIEYPAISERVDFEGELGVVIGHRAHHVSREEAEACIAGYTCVNDVTARDLQKKDGQWTRGKGFDTFCPVGPWIVPRTEVHFDALRVRTFVNGELRQDAPVTDMIFPVARIIEFVTEFMTLEPGDLLATGTPSGVGPLTPGSVVRVDIEGLGALENRVVKP
jgi:2-keto-4-pentenoate hydratase/2-oxohepta-3-ene-1,7-dioic acid hydratase in catechol pathway